MLETQLVSVNFGQGVDTKSDPKLVVAGKLLRLENAVFTKAKRLVKRNGYTLISSSIVSGGSLSAPNLVSTFNGELVCQDAGKFYAYSPSIGKWVEKGRYVSCKVTNQPISSGEYDARRSSGTKLGNYSISAWDIGTSQVGYSIFDDVTGTRAAAEQKITGNFSKSCNLGTTWMGLFYVDTVAGELAVQGFNVTSSGVSTLSEVVVGSDIAQNTVDALNQIPQYDCATTSAGFAVAYGYGATYGGGQSGLKVKTFNASGVLQNSATVSTASALSVCTVVDSTNGNIWVYWIENSTGKIFYAVFDSTLGVVLAKTQITAGTAPGQVVASSSSATQQAVYFTDNFSSGFVNAYKLKTCSVTSGGTVGSISTLHVNVDIWGKPIKVGSSTYLPLLSGPTTDQAIYLVDCSDGYVAAKTLYGKAYAPRSSGFWAVPYLFSSSKVVCSAEMVNTQGYSPLGGAGPYPAASVYGFLRQAINCTFDFAHADTYQALTDGDNLILNGGVVQAYDAQSTTELGFLSYPQVTTSSATVGGNIAAGTYSYIAVFQWYDAQGNLHQSAPSLPVSVTFGSGVTTGKVDLTISCLSLTQKKAAAGRADIQIAIYRTVANGTLYYQVSSLLASTLNSATASTVSFSDTYADSAISGNNLPYTNGGVVENIPPPPAVLMASHNNRLWLVSSEDDTVWYSKTILPTVGVSMSDLFTVQVQENFGRISGIYEMDEKLVIFKAERPFYLAGDGANDIGGGVTLTTPQPVSADVGCSASKSVVLIPSGLIFKSPKGIYLLDRALNVSYLGFEVEDYNAQDITSAVVCYDKNQVRLLTSSGKTLVYDYVFNQWSTFTNHTGSSACLYGGVYVYAKTGGSIFQESSTSYLDNATSFAVLAQTAHIKMGAVQGLQRVRRMALLGDYANGSSASHGVKMSVAYDYGSSFSTPISYTFGAASASGVFQYRERLPVQKCESLSILIEEVTNSVSGEFIDLTDLTLEVGIKRGINKLPAAQSVG